MNHNDQQLNEDTQLSEELLEYARAILEIYDGKIAREKGTN
jgi:hypothetical protein